jgi:elongation factor Ts
MPRAASRCTPTPSHISNDPPIPEEQNMAKVSIADIKALRERLGTGMVATKKALEEADGNVEKAVELLRLKGAKGNAKRADRSTSEGLVAAHEGADVSYLIELDCETDFVAKNSKFIALADRVLASVVAAGAEDVDAALAAPAGAGTVADAIAEEAAVIGEKIALRRVAAVRGDVFSIYLHKTSKDLPPQVGVILAYRGDDAATARSIAQHISFADPRYLSRDEVPADAVENERRIVEEISRKEGKPEAALPKIIEGRLRSYFKQIVLLEQDYARDNKLSVQQVVNDAGLTVTGFARFRVGA